MCEYFLHVSLFGIYLIHTGNYDPWLNLFNAGVEASFYMLMGRGSGQDFLPPGGLKHKEIFLCCSTFTFCV